MVIKIPKNLYFVNVGEKSENWIRNNPNEPFAQRNWDNSKKFGFMSAGQGRKWSKQIEKLESDDIIVAFITGDGYVGIGKILDEAIPISQFQLLKPQFENNSLMQIEDQLYPTDIFLNATDINGTDNIEKCEYVVNVEWFEDKVFPRRSGKWETLKPKLLATQRIVSNLLTSTHTIDFIEQKFGVKFQRLNPVNNQWTNIITIPI